MAKKKTKNSKKNNTDLNATSLSQSSKVKEPRVGDSYISLALGIIVVIAIAAVVVAFIRGNEYSVDTVIPQEDIEKASQPEIRKYTIQEGEGLWDVAVKFYGDGFMWVKIVEVNKLDNPDLIAPGTEIIIPEIE